MDSSTFERLAERTLAAMLARIEERLGDRVEVDLNGGILTVELDDGRTFVVNRHGPNRQLWLSSPVSGAAHFDWDEARQTWLSTRGGVALSAVLAHDLAAAAGGEIDFG